MSQKADDLEAVRTIAEALKPFTKEEQERILRWAREKVGLGTPTTQTQSAPPATVSAGGPVTPIDTGGTQDIRSFYETKQPKSDTHFAATVAYYYRFEAPQAMRKESVSGEDLQDACRRVGRTRLTNPGQTLRNAHRDGLMDKAEPGSFTLNSVGENLVAMTLPAETSRRSPSRKKTKKANKKSAKKKPKKKAAKKKPSRKRR